MTFHRHLRSAVFVLGIFGVCAACLAESDPGAGAPVAADLPAGVQDVVRMVQAGVSEPVVLAQIKSSGQVYRLTADQIITLTQDGVSQNIIQALVQTGMSAAAAEPPSSAEYTATGSPPSPPPTGPAPDETVAAPQAPPGDTGAPVNFSYFWTELYPYGNWIQVPGYGWCWRPSIIDQVPNWRPYADGGQWVYTDTGWFWQSEYPWGDCVFHYGRWLLYPGYGWVWVPDYTWGPAWVCWRQDEIDGFCGWAPLPPGVRFVAGVGLWYDGQICWDSDFGLGLDLFVFAPYGHFWGRGWYRYAVYGPRAAEFYHRSVVRNGYHLVNGRLADEGLGRARIEAIAHRNLPAVAARAEWSREFDEHRQVREAEVRSFRAPAYRPAYAPQSYGYRAGPAYARPYGPANYGRPADAAPESRGVPAPAYRGPEGGAAGRGAPEPAARSGGGEDRRDAR